jgi:dienelactone hydrolase
MGVTEHEKSTARRLAGAGFVAFALDIYGAGNRPADRAAAGRLAGTLKNDAPLLRKRAALGLEQLKGFTWTDKNRCAAIGFCFGGTTVLELARSGADIQGVVSLHGGLSTANPSDANNIKCKVLVLHGADDPYAPLEEVHGLIKEMSDAGVDYEVILYGGAVHSFTQREAGSDKSSGAAYDEQAARRSWRDMLNFFDEIFQLKPAKSDAPNAWTEK